MTGVDPVAQGYIEDVGVYNPYMDRMFPYWKCEDTNRVIRDIDVGDELLYYYLTYGGSEYWDENVIELKRICSGDAVGSVKAYEDDSKHT